jgi:hypothetical protein
VASVLAGAAAGGLTALAALGATGFAGALGRLAEGLAWADLGDWLRFMVMGVFAMN